MPVPATVNEFTPNPTRMNEVMMNLACMPNGIKIGFFPLELIDLPVYQRKDERNIARIAANWDDSKCGFVELSAHHDHANVMDGGHRCRAARLSGKTHIPAIVRTGLTVPQEAAIFAHQHDNTTQLTPLDKFKAALTAGEPAAVTLYNIARSYHIEIKKSTGPNSTGILRAVGQALRIAERNPSALDFIFGAIREFGWHTEPGAYSETFIIALYQIYLRYESVESANLSRLVDVCSKVSPRTFELNARSSYIDRGPAPAVVAMMEAVIRGSVTLEDTAAAAS